MGFEKECVSVIVPVYNVEPYLSKCLDSIVGQTYRYLDVILVDDGSTDCSGRICDEYADRDGRIRVLHKKNGGLVSARKAGAEMAKGEHAIVVDSDDWIDEEAVAYIADTFGRIECDMIVMGFIKEYAAFSEVRAPQVAEGVYSSGELEIQVLEHERTQKAFFSPIFDHSLWSKAFKTDFYRRHQMAVDDGIRIGEDCAVCAPMFFNAENIVVSDKTFYHYRSRKTSTTNTSDDEDHRSMERLAASLTGCFGGRLPDSAWGTYTLQCIAYFMLLSVPESFLGDDGFIFYPEINAGDRIALYGKGAYGARLGQVLSQYADIKGVFDQSDYAVLADTHQEYDYIVIAILIGTVVEEVAEKMIQSGIPEEKILYIRQNMLRYYL